MKRFALRTFALILIIGLVGIGSAAARSLPDGDVGRRNARASDAERLRFSAPSFAEAQAPEALTQGLRLLRSDETGLVLELQTPDYDLTAQDTCTRLTVPGYADTDRVGWPQLPVRGVMVGVPPDADLSLTVLESETVSLPGYHQLCPVPKPVIEREISGEPRYAGQVLERDRAAYAADRLTPSTVAEIAATGRLRSQRVAQLRLSPFQVNPATGELRHIRRLRVRLDFDRGATSMASEATTVAEGPFETTLRDTLLNYTLARAWRIPPEPTAPQVNAHPQVSTEVYKVEVDQDGVYQITAADLAAAGVDVESIDSRTFQMHNRGEEVALHVTGGADGAFDPGDQLRFYGQKTETRYTDVNVYWLRWGGADGRRMADRDGTPDGAGVTPTTFTTTVRWEENHNYQSSIPSGEGGDHWFADYINTTSPTSKTYTLELHNLATTPYSATMRGRLYGYSHFAPTPDHHTRVYLNGHLVDDATWDGWREYQFEHDIPGSYLEEGLNEITVELPFDLGPEVINDIVFVNWFEIDYQDTHVAENDALLFNETDAGTWAYQVSGFTTDTLRVIDVTSPTAPVRILSPTVETVSSTFSLRFEDAITAPRRYLALSSGQQRSPLRIERDAPSDLRAATHGADYVILTHGDFITDVVPLADYRAAQGLRTRIVDVQDVYDEFNDGIFNPTALRDFLAYAYEHWTPPAPAYVLLVGDGNYDFKDNFGFGEPSYVPPYLAYVDPWIGETAADNRYVCVSGDDTLPDMHLGRLPVKTRAEASLMVDRILAYEQAPPSGDWQRQLLFVADNADPKAGEFDDLSDEIADHFVPSPYVTQTIYYKVTHTTVGEAKADIIDAINEGRLLVNYIGHAAQQFWAFEHLFDLDDIALLTNTERLPLMVPMTCLDGYYIYPSPEGSDLSSLGESFVRAPGGGAIASWSPTGMGVSTGHDFLNKGLYEAIFFDDVIELGPAATRAKLYLYSNSASYRDLLDTYLLFGDPALRLNVLLVDVGITKTVDPPDAVNPGDSITYTLTYTNAGPATAHHVVITDALSSALTSPTVFSSGATIHRRLGSRLAWDVADLPAGGGGVITITATVSPTFQGGLANTATITTDAVEDDVLNNLSSTVTTVGYPVYLPVVMRYSGP